MERKREEKNSRIRSNIQHSSLEYVTSSYIFQRDKGTEGGRKETNRRRKRATRSRRRKKEQPTGERKLSNF